MRLSVLLAVPFVMGFSPANELSTDPARALAFDLPGYSRPAAPATGDLEDFVRRATCRDTIRQARAASGQPPLLERGPASADEPLLYKAVDRKVDGCDVLVMVGDPNDIRPVPPAPEGRPLIIPAE